MVYNIASIRVTSDRDTMCRCTSPGFRSRGRGLSVLSQAFVYATFLQPVYYQGPSVYSTSEISASAESVCTFVEATP